LPKELLAGGRKSGEAIFHFYTMKVSQIKQLCKKKTTEHQKILSTE